MIFWTEVSTTDLTRKEKFTEYSFWDGDLRVRFFKKIKDWILKSKESENGFCVSLLNRSIQDLLDHGASKKEESILEVDSSP